ncbi:hypothetical protein MUY14_43150 [Amycolatopsis sp. FBCC-B4732]|uniref:hypothetical protein n=1 Tax=Amycolatopsis sp. FBCC-B4732 TaxID=3079339 RepID=UPI001FF5A984|nr:hypothetical protein [Amycolatopsis sp. FBCC-B4732]UOX88409.1 hypothetical protein MUY14_43150 [Amycolatopsis sp. FBCC-B4732]
MGNTMSNDPGTDPIVIRNLRDIYVTAYRVTVDDRKITVHGPDGPRTRTCRRRNGYAQTAMLREMGYDGLFALCPHGTDDSFCYTTTLPF